MREIEREEGRQGEREQHPCLAITCSYQMLSMRNGQDKRQLCRSSRHWQHKEMRYKFAYFIEN